METKLIPIDQIDESTYKDFRIEETRTKELIAIFARSIAENGQSMPIRVYKKDPGDKFQYGLVTGMSRFLAMKHNLSAIWINSEISIEKPPELLKSRLSPKMNERCLAKELTLILLDITEDKPTHFNYILSLADDILNRLLHSTYPGIQLKKEIVKKENGECYFKDPEASAKRILRMHYWQGPILIDKLISELHTRPEISSKEFILNELKQIQQQFKNPTNI